MTSVKNFEQKRQAAIESYEDFNGPMEKSQYAQNSANYYQVQQAVEIVSETLKTFIMQNPVILTDPELFKLALSVENTLEEIGSGLSAGR